MKDLSVGEIFSTARNIWSPVSPEFRHAADLLNDRFGRIERELASSSSAWLLDEYFGITAHPDQVISSADLTALIQIVQFLEDVYYGCDIATHWEHPMNQGWLSYFDRWTNVSVLRLVWPVLAPIFTPPFQSFLKQRFSLATGAAIYECRAVSQSARYALDAFRNWSSQPAFSSRADASTQVLELVFKPNSTQFQTCRLGMVVVERVNDADHHEVWRWRTDGLWIPWRFRGGGHAKRFVQAIVKRQRRLASSGYCEVHVEATLVGANSGRIEDMRLRSAAYERAERVALIEFYRRLGFQLRTQSVNQERVQVVLDTRPR